jgi:single-strand DNA-binding protein
MAAGLNRVSIIGNLGKDPEIRQTAAGTSVGNLNIGVTEKRKEGDEYKDQTEWISVVVFGKTAENASKYLQKGRQVFVEGRLQTRKWEDKTGQTRYTTEVIASQLLFLGSAKDNNSFSSQAPSAASLNESSMDSDNFIDDDDIPF